MSTRELAMVVAVGVMVCIHFVAKWWEQRKAGKIQNPSPPPSPDDADEASEHGERPAGGGRPRGDVDLPSHGPADCPNGDRRCRECAGLPYNWQPADVDDEPEEDDDEPEETSPAGFRGWLRNLGQEIIHGGPQRR